MCGIVGFITTEGHKGSIDRAMFMEQALIIDILRGEDSTGIMYGNTLEKDHHAGYYKSAENGYEFSQSKEFQAILKKVHNYSFMVGHNRAATIGNITPQTAHPFKEGKVLGLHNGTVRGNMDTLPITFDKSGCEVDSNAIIKNLNHVDPDEALSKVISKIQGAYMLVWRDDRDGSLNFARNATRSFHLMQSYAEDTLYFASEHGQLAWMNDRLALGGADVTSLVPGKALKFKEGDLDPEVLSFDIAPKYATATKAKVYTGAAATTGKRSTTPGKPVAPRGQVMGGSDNKVQVGGRPRKLPTPLSTRLRTLPVPLAVEDRLQFTPILRQPKEQLASTGAVRWVSGMIDSLGMPATLYGVEKHVCDGAWERRWTVRPLGVKYISQDGRVEPMLVCSLVASVGQPERMTLRNSLPTLTEESRKANPAGLLGPEGNYISTVDWLNQTIDGCCVCERPLQANEAAEIRWDLVTKEPQCPDCAANDDAAIAALDFGGHSPLVH